MPPSQRRCSTCRHFQVAPLWRKGWCRNPLLYAPHQNHLVDERALDCDRQFGDYWEALEMAPEMTAEDDEAIVTPTVPEPVLAQPAPVAKRALVDPAAVLRPGPVPRPEPTRRRPVRPRRTAVAVAPPRTQRDYVRFAVPAAAFLVLLIGYTVWTGVLFRSATMQAAAPVVMTATPVGVTTPAAVLTALNPTATSAPAIPPTSVPATNTPVPPTATAVPATPAPTTLRPGLEALVETGTGEGLRLRREPSRSSETILSIRQGHRALVLEGPRSAEGQEWWKVEYEGKVGWAAGAFLKPGS